MNEQIKIPLHLPAIFVWNDVIETKILKVFWGFEELIAPEKGNTLIYIELKTHTTKL